MTPTERLLNNKLDTILGLLQDRPELVQRWVSATEFKTKFGLSRRQLEKRCADHPEIRKAAPNGNHSYLYDVILYTKILNS